MSRLPRWPQLVAALFIVALAWAARELHDARIRIPEEEGWLTYDADSFYHDRRVARVFEEGLPVAAEDPFLDFPHGAKIPWPPYYTLLASAAVAPGMPSDATARRGHIERGLARLPRIFGVGTSLLTTAAGWSVAGPAAGLFAGAYHALALASISYSRIGIADHHAWISLLLMALLFGTARSLAPGALGSSRKGAIHGLALGCLAGVMLGCWVASLVYVVVVQLVLGLLLPGHARAPRPGLAPLGLAFHLGAIATVLPAVWSSPWKEDAPWVVVELSWFHLAHLALGALVFLPLLGGRSPRGYPWILASALVLAVAVLLGAGGSAGSAVRDAFAWAGRTDTFMSGIRESRPLLGAGSEGAGELFQLLGYGVLALPVAWVVLTWTCRTRRQLLPWVVALPVLGVQAALQARFADSLAAPLAVGVGALGLCLPRTSRRATWAAVLLALPLALLAQAPSATATWRIATAEGPVRGGPLVRRARALRSMLAWLRENTPATRDYAVLAAWQHGHAIEWAAERPTVATNFGSYLGDDSFAQPARFLLAEDGPSAEAVLERRRARYVLVTAQLPSSLAGLLEASSHPEPGRFLERYDAYSGTLRAAWFATVGASLIQGGRPRTSEQGEPGASLDFVRLVHAARVADPPGGGPYGWIWEHVPGARIEASATAGSVLTIEFEVDYAAAGHRIRFARTAVAGADGVVRMRVPYATMDDNGDGRVLGVPRWTLAQRSGPLRITEADVLEGRTVSLE